MIRPLRLRRLQRTNEHLSLPCHDHLRRQPPGPNVADQADTITAPTFLDEALVALTQLDVVDGTSFAHR